MNSNFKDWLENELDRDLLENENDLENFEMVWKAAQKNLWKNILKNFDADIDGIFGEKWQVTDSKAQLVGYIASLKAFFAQQYKFCKQKGDK